MNSAVQEAGKQKFDHFKKQAMLALTTAFRAPLMLMMGCGYIRYQGVLMPLHDFEGKLTVNINPYRSEPYDADKHGEKIDFVEEGQVIPNQSNSTQDKRPIHRHNEKNTSSGAYRYRYE